jgi:two-component system, LytTR family, sensor kinase
LKKNACIYGWFLLVITIFGGSRPVFAQPAAFSTEFFNSSHGLPSPEIISLAKDSKGFLWIGTAAGISRYDGYTFHNYARTRQNELVGYVNALVTDDKDRLWIGSDAGLFCRINDDVVKLSAASNMPQGIYDILLEKNGTIWLATEMGIARIQMSELDFSGTKKASITDHLLPHWRSGNSIGNIILIEQATDGTMYIAQHTRLFRLDNEQPVLLHNIDNTRDLILAVIPVDKNKVYINTVITEIHRIENDIHTSIPHKDLYKPGVDDALPGQWLLCTFGLYYFHPETAVASRFVNITDMGIIWASMLLKEDQFFWLATHHGLVKIKPSIFTAYNPNTSPSAKEDFYSFLHLQNGSLLLGANRTIILEKRDTSFQVWPDLGSRAEIKCLYEDENGWLWAGTGYKGLILVKNKKPRTFTADDGLHDNSFSSFLKTRNNKLYAIGDQGLTEIIVDKNDSITFKKHTYTPNITKHAKFYSGIEAPDGSILIGGEEGLFRLKNNSLQPCPINNRQIAARTIVSDKAGSVWIATDDEGILQCMFTKNNELELARQYTESDGLNTLHYLTILADKDDNIWAGSSKGLTFIGRTGKYKGHLLHFDESDGFIRPGYYYINLYQDRQGTIWAGTTFGFISFQPTEAFLSSNAPVIYITGIRQIKANEFVKDPAATDRFAHNNNSFHFGYTALDYANQASIRYYYKLEGLDTNWVNAGSQRSISYENLPPGKYVFHVKALNSKGKWSNNDSIYAFTITLPFWKQWWFILAYTVILIAVVIFVVKRRIASVQKKEAEQTALQKLKATVYREQLEIEQIINHFATSMNSITNIDELLWNVAKDCISKLGFEDCVIYLKDESEDVLIQKAAWGPKTTEENKIINPIRIPYGKGIVGSVAASGHAEIVSDTTTDSRYIVDDTRRFSEIAVPIIDNGRVTGVIDSEHHQKNFYTERHLQILTTIAALCAGKISIIQAGQQTKEKEMEVLRLSKDFATSQLTTLRMQMNPHFIFNALNSIQHYILQGNVADANKYLSKFSKLQRDILHCSSQPFISLEKELEILNAYLQLEQYRFGDSFVYKIGMTEDIEPVEIRIPPMILQPFVENAIWHGLMPRQGERSLNIYFDLYNDDILQATIRDNGIGRAASARLKQSNGETKTGHESKGMSMVQQRLQLLQQQHDQPFEVAISDITDIHGEVQGTQVTLKIYIGNKKS